MCSTEIADCTTNDPDSPFPHELDNDTKKIYIYYYGQDITVNEGMLHHFNKLAELHLGGNFRAIQSNAFSKLLNLEKLTLNNVSLTKIEDDAFGSNSSLTYLNLTSTKMELIPTNVFHSLVYVQVLDLTDNNNMMVCSSDLTNIGEEFKLLSSLKKLKMDNIGNYGVDGVDTYHTIILNQLVKSASFICLSLGSLKDHTHF